jgi:hypothetical protein
MRGRGRRERLEFYNQDLREMFAQVALVLKPGAKAALVRRCHRRWQGVHRNYADVSAQSMPG